MATGLSHPGKSREGPGTRQDRTGPRDLKGPVVPGLQKSKSPGTFFPRSRDSPDPFPGQDFANKVQN